MGNRLSVLSDDCVSGVGLGFGDLSDCWEWGGSRGC